CCRLTPRSRPVFSAVYGACPAERVLGPPFTAGTLATETRTTEPRLRGFSVHGFSHEPRLKPYTEKPHKWGSGLTLIHPISRRQRRAYYPLRGTSPVNRAEEPATVSIRLWTRVRDTRL